MMNNIQFFTNLPGSASLTASTQIGRASCRERVQISVVAVSLKKKKKEKKRKEKKKKKKKQTSVDKKIQRADTETAKRRRTRSDVTTEVSTKQDSIRQPEANDNDEAIEDVDTICRRTNN